MNERLIVVSSKYEKLEGYPGQSTVSQVKGFADNTRSAEVFAYPGLEISPPKDSQLIYLPLGGSQSFGVTVAGHNYKIAPVLDQGGIRIYSTDANGSQVKSSIVLKPNGDIAIESNGNVSVDAQTDLTLNAMGNVSVDASQDVSVTAGGNVSLDGMEVQLNGSDESLVRFSDLDSALQQFVSSLNQEFAKKQDLAGSPGALSLDISQAEVDDVKVG